jgi:hypothetical protein
VHETLSHSSDLSHRNMSTQGQIEDTERRALLGICSLQQTLQYEPVPFHRTLTIHEVRDIFETGVMPVDEPEDVADRERQYDESTWIKGGDVSVWNTRQGRR